MPLALNSGNALYFWPLVLLERLSLPPNVELELHRRLSRTMLRCHHGQALDLQAKIGDVAQGEIPQIVAAISDLKTGGLMELAATLGPVASHSSAAIEKALSEFGRAVGVGLQMLNDLADLGSRRDPLKCFEDLRHGRLNWPWAWLAQVLDAAEFADFEAHAVRVHRHGAEAEALADRLKSRLGNLARALAHRHLEAAVDRLALDCGMTLEVNALQEEIARLETCYG
jgi:geranylgeranyl pyrophosphate synthase